MRQGGHKQTNERKKQKTQLAKRCWLWPTSRKSRIASEVGEHSRSVCQLSGLWEAGEGSVFTCGRQASLSGLDFCCVVMATPAARHHTHILSESLLKTKQEKKKKIVRDLEFHINTDAVDQRSSGGALRYSPASLGYFGAHVTRHVWLTLTFIPMSKEKQDHSAQFHHRRPSMPLAPQCPLRVTLSYIIYYTVIGSETTGHTWSGYLTCMFNGTRWT